MPRVTHKPADGINALDVSILVFLVGLVSSKALLAIGMVLVCVTALWYFRHQLRNGPLVKYFLPPLLIFIMTLLSGINSEDYTSWLAFVSKKSPFLFLPIAFYLSREQVSRRFYDYLMTFVVIVAIVSLGVLTNYLMNFDALNQAIEKGQAITTPVDHTEYSIFVAFACLVSLFLYNEEKRVIKIGTKGTLLLLSLFLFIFLHVLAVRSGLAVLYLSGIALGLYTVITRKNYKLLAGMLVFFVLAPIIAVNVVPSLKKKMSYANWDLGQYKEGKGLNYSDSERLYSLQVGVEIFKEHKLVGTGIGDLKAACQEQYQEKLGRKINHFPHNQILFVLAGMGFVGLGFYLLAAFLPLIYMRGHYDPYFLALHCIVFLSAMVENTVERTFSIGFYLFFLLSSICYLTRTWEQAK